jgi:hypothetical protein
MVRPEGKRPLAVTDPLVVEPEVHDEVQGGRATEGARSPHDFDRTENVDFDEPNRHAIERLGQ